MYLYEETGEVQTEKVSYQGIGSCWLQRHLHSVHHHLKTRMRMNCLYCQYDLYSPLMLVGFYCLHHPLPIQSSALYYCYTAYVDDIRRWKAEMQTNVTEIKTQFSFFSKEDSKKAAPHTDSVTVFFQCLMLISFKPVSY
jgi:CO dehydrogenase/acetyl-CoA synthase beta subunit